MKKNNFEILKNADMKCIKGGTVPPPETVSPEYGPGPAAPQGPGPVATQGPGPVATQGPGPVATQ